MVNNGEKLPKKIIKTLPELGGALDSSSANTKQIVGAINTDGTNGDIKSAETSIEQVIAEGDGSSDVPNANIDESPTILPESDVPTVISPGSDLLKEVKALRKTTANDLTNRFGKRKQVPGTSGAYWSSASQDEVFVVRADGTEALVLVGERHNFGNRQQSLLKTWGGEEKGWIDTSHADMTRARGAGERNTIASLKQKNADLSEAQHSQPWSAPEDFVRKPKTKAVLEPETPKAPVNPRLEPKNEPLDKEVPKPIDPDTFEAVHKGVGKFINGVPNLVPQGEVKYYLQKEKPFAKISIKEFEYIKRGWDEFQLTKQKTPNPPEKPPVTFTPETTASTHDSRLDSSVPVKIDDFAIARINPNNWTGGGPTSESLYQHPRFPQYFITQTQKDLLDKYKGQIKTIEDIKKIPGIGTLQEEKVPPNPAESPNKGLVGTVTKDGKFKYEIVNGIMTKIRIKKNGKWVLENGKAVWKKEEAGPHANAPEGGAGKTFEGTGTNPAVTPPNNPEASAGGRGNKDEPPTGGAGTIFEASGTNPPAETKQDWTIHPEQYIGVKIKSIPEIINNPRDQQLFGELLKVLAPDSDELNMRGYNGTLTDADQEIITFAQYEFAKGLKQAEEVIAQMKITDVELIMKRDPRFNQMATMVGAANMFEILKEELPHMAMRNRESVEDLFNTYKHLNDDRKSIRYKFWDSKVRSYLKRYEIGEQDFSKLDTEAGRTEMGKQLEEKYRNEAGTFIRTADWVFTKTKIKSQSVFNERANQAMDNARRLNEPTMPLEDKWYKPKILQRIFRGPTASILREVDGHLQNITTVLSHTVNMSEEEQKKRVEGWTTLDGKRMPGINDMPDGAEKRRAISELHNAKVLQQKTIAEAFSGKKLTHIRDTGPQSSEELNAQKTSLEQVKITPEKFQADFDVAKIKYKTPEGKGWDQQTEQEHLNFRDNIYTPQEYQQAENNSGGLGFWASIFRALFRSRIKEEKKKLQM